MRLTQTFVKDRARVCSLVLCPILFVSANAAGLKTRHEPAQHQWTVKYEEGTQDIGSRTKVKLTIGKREIVCRSKTRNEVHVVVIPVARITEIAHSKEYRSVLSLVFGEGDTSALKDMDPHAAMVLLPVLIPMAVVDREAHFVKISWRSRQNEESFVVLRVRKSDVTTLLGVLESCSGKRSVDLWAERGKAIQDSWDHSPMGTGDMEHVGENAPQSPMDATLQAGSASVSVQSRLPVESGHAAISVVNRGGIALCSLLAPDSDAYRVSCRLRDGEVPRELLPSSPRRKPIDLTPE